MATEGTSRRYRVGELAKLVGVSVRLLHHYDLMGVVRPSARSEAGYRLYAEEDLLRLQQALTLRCLGFPLRRIRELLTAPGADAAAALGAQRRVLAERIAELQRVDRAIGAALAAHGGGAWDWNLVLSAAEAAGTAYGGIEMEKLYTQEEMSQFAELRNESPAEEVAAVEREWTALLADVRASYELNPASPAAKALVERWDALTARTMAHFASKPGLPEAIGRNYEAGAFEDVEGAPRAADMAFIERARGS